MKREDTAKISADTEAAILSRHNERALYASLRDLNIKSYQTSDLNQYLDFLDSSGYGLADGLSPYIEH